MNKIYNYLFFILLSIFSIFFIVKLSSSSLFNTTYQIDIIEESSYSEFINIEGIALRDERLITDDNDFSFLNYHIVNGDRVGKLSTIATYNIIPLPLQSQIELDIINNKIKQLEDSTESKILFDIVTIDDLIKEKINSILFTSESGSYKNLVNQFNDLQVLFNKKDIKLVDTDYYNKTLTNYLYKKEEILSEHGTKEIYIKSPAAGYFTSQYDGFEFITADNNLELSVSQFKDIMGKSEMPIPDKYVGKLQMKPTWYFVALMDSTDAISFFVNTKIALEFDIPYSGTKKFNTTITHISKSFEEKSVVVFKCDIMNVDVLSIRKETCRLIIKNHFGMKISQSAIRKIDDQIGVFVIIGKIAVFKPINVLYATEDFSIVEASSNVSSKILLPKDEVIVGGKDLFDGKIIN